MINALSKLMLPNAPPEATAWAISCKEPPATIPNCESVKPKTGLSPISNKVKTVPITQTTATAKTSFSLFLSSLAAVICGETPITAAAPQTPHPHADKNASSSSAPNLRLSQ